MLSLWSLPDGHLVSRFLCDQNDSFLAADSTQATLFSLSHDNRMLATWTPKGNLSIFLCQGGLMLSSLISYKAAQRNSVNETIKELLWLEEINKFD